MGQRQSSPEQPEEQQQQQQSTNNSRERVIRPSSRTQVERINPIYINRNPPNMQYIPLNDSQRRAERRYRRSQLREQREQQRERQAFEAQQQQQEREQERAQAHQEQTQHELTENPSGVTMTNITNTMNSYSSLSPFARMLAQVISEAVVASFRSGQIQFNASAFQGSDRQDDNRNIRQQLTMHLSPELFQQMEPESDENSFMRFMRLPVIISSIVSSNQSEGATPEDQGTSERVNSSQSTTSSTATTNNNNPSTTTTTTSSTENSSNNQSSSTGLLNNDEVTRILMLPVFLYGIRSNHQLNLSSVLNDDDSSTSEQPVRRQSQRLRERQQREEDNNNNAEEETRNSNNNNDNNNTSNGSGNNGQWTVYIISGNSVENIMSERNPTYEELLDLASIIGPARRPTVSQEAIDSHVPIVKYTQQVKQNIIGNSEGCQVCLNAYQSEEDVRILACHHGFHKECIDKWLTEGQNQCPLCRNVPVPTNSSS